jgi:hypothetical protein
MAYQYVAAITIDNTKVSGSSNFTDFPVLIKGVYAGSGTDPDFRTVANGGDIQNTDASGGADGATTVPADFAFFSDLALTTPLNFEVIKYNATTGEIIVSVKIPTLNYNVDTNIYIGYNDSGVTTSQENISGAWNSDFAAVYHKESSAVDSLGSYDGADTDITYSDANGKIGNGGGYNGATSKINIGQVIDSPGASFAIAAWIKTSESSNLKRIVSKYAGAGAPLDGDIIFDKKDTNQARLRIWGTTDLDIQTTNTINDDSWHRVWVVVISGTAYIYLDGSLKASGSCDSSIATRAIDWGIGEDAAGADNENWAGSIDEVYLLSNGSNISLDWIVTEYNNQNSPATFYSISAASLATVTTETPATNITSISAEGGGNVTDDGGGTVSERGVVWGTSPNPTIAGNKQASGSGTGAFTGVAITGLDPDTHYYYRAYAINEAGTAYGADVEFDTLDAVISGTCTLNGSPVQNAVITLINSDTDAVVNTTTSDVNGDYSFTGLDVTVTYHVTAEYEDSPDQYNARSLPFMVPEEV